MDSPIAANVFGTMGAVLWSLQLLPQIWKNWRRHDSESLSTLFFMSWAIAGVPLGVYNIVEDFNIALQCKYYREKWDPKKITLAFIFMSMFFGGLETGLVFALRLARERGQKWALTLMAFVAAILLAAGVLRHYIDMLKTRSDAGLSLKFALLDAGGDIASILSVVFQPSLSILGLVIYGTELGIWLGLIGLVLYFRIVNRHKAADIEMEQ